MSLFVQQIFHTLRLDKNAFKYTITRQKAYERFNTKPTATTTTTTTTNEKKIIFIILRPPNKPKQLLAVKVTNKQITKT